MLTNLPESPNKNISDKNLIWYFVALGLILTTIIGLGFFLRMNLAKSDYAYKIDPNPYQNNSNNTSDASSLETFKSCEDLAEQLKSNIQNENIAYPMLGKSTMSMDSSRAVSAPAAEFSGTNNQVQNVDEGDIVKTDGTYIYTLNGRNINITKVDSETGELQKISKISLNNSFDVVSYLNLYENKLLVSGSKYNQNGGSTLIQVYDLGDKNKPNKIREVSVAGDSITSRMVNGVVYLATNYYGLNTFFNDQKNLSKPVQELNFTQNYLPQLYDTLISVSRNEAVVSCDQIQFIKPIKNMNLLSFISIDLKDNKPVVTSSVLGAANEVYASEKNMYLASTDYNYNQNPEQKTQILKFNLNDGDIKFQAAQSVNGRIINQFAMDEFEDNFRIATTVNYNEQNFNPGIPTPFTTSVLRIPDQSSSQDNNIFILDKNLNQIGSLQGLAKGENIYSVRFMGKKGYMVTFKKVDPLFTFDLSDPKNPKVLGELKIPGYSDYLHPISENLIIGVGKNTEEAVDTFGDSQNFAWYQGLKLGLFDVTDMNNPKEISKIEIGDRGTDSDVLRDHKAFLWDERNNLLTLPVSLYLISDSDKQTVNENLKQLSPGMAPPQGISSSQYGQFKYQGSYVYEVTKENGFKLKGRISHLETKAIDEKKPEIIIKKYDEFGQLIEQKQVAQTNIAIGEPYPNSSNDPNYYIKRQVYINNFLITFSDKQLQSNKIQDLKLVNNIGF